MLSPTCKRFPVGIHAPVCASVAVRVEREETNFCDRNGGSIAIHFESEPEFSSRFVRCSSEYFSGLFQAELAPILPENVMLIQDRASGCAHRGWSPRFYRLWLLFPQSNGVGNDGKRTVVFNPLLLKQLGRSCFLYFLLHIPCEIPRENSSAVLHCSNSLLWRWLYMGRSALPLSWLEGTFFAKYLRRTASVLSRTMCASRCKCVMPHRRAFEGGGHYHRRSRRRLGLE